jgi:hypothetical protein
METEILASEEILLPYSEDFWAVRSFLGLEPTSLWARLVDAYPGIADLRRELEQQTIDSSV